MQERTHGGHRLSTDRHQATQRWRSGRIPLSRPRASAYIWLAYSIFFFFEPLFRHSLRYWIECLAIYAVFLVMYVALDVIEIKAVKLSMLGGFVILGLAAFPFNQGASTFFSTPPACCHSSSLPFPSCWRLS